VISDKLGRDMLAHDLAPLPRGDIGMGCLYSMRQFNRLILSSIFLIALLAAWPCAAQDNDALAANQNEFQQLYKTGRCR
jgi:hypothetical protein